MVRGNNFRKRSAMLLAQVKITGAKRHTVSQRKEGITMETRPLHHQQGDGEEKEQPSAAKWRAQPAWSRGGLVIPPWALET